MKGKDIMKEQEKEGFSHFKLKLTLFFYSYIVPFWMHSAFKDDSPENTEQMIQWINDDTEFFKNYNTIQYIAFNLNYFLGEDFYLLDFIWEDPLRLAFKHNIEIAEAMIDKNLHAPDDIYYLCASPKATIELFKKLSDKIEDKIDLSKALRFACEAPINIEIAKHLIEKVADINIKITEKNSILHLACKAGNLDLVKILLKKGADINAKNNKNETPLHFAAQSLSSDIVNLLIKNGADINAKDQNDKTCAESIPFYQIIDGEFQYITDENKTKMHDEIKLFATDYEIVCNIKDALQNNNHTSLMNNIKKYVVIHPELKENAKTALMIMNRFDKGKAKHNHIPKPIKQMILANLSLGDEGIEK